MGNSHTWIKMWAWGTWKGAGRFQKMWHITVPGLLPTFFVLLLMAIAGILSNGLDQYLVFENADNRSSIRVLDLYVYRLGIGSGSIPLSTVVGMFKSVISVILLFGANAISKLNMDLLGLTGNYLVYILPGIVAPYNIILVKTYIESIPAELEESAFIDGASYMVVFRKLILPLSKPILATVAIFGAVGHWNSFQDSLLYMQGNEAMFTLQHRLYNYLNTASNLGTLMSQGST